MAKQLTSKETFFEKHGYRVDNYIYFKVIDGDKSDDLPGVNGIGKKTFIKLFPQMAEEHVNNIDELLDFSRHVVGSKSKVYTKSMKSKHSDILAVEELVRKNYQLMQLENVNISIQSKDVCSEIQIDQPNGFNRFKLRTMFIQDKLNSHVKYFDDWSRVFSSLMSNGKKKG
jgi:5'-3' exonuclease